MSRARRERERNALLPELARADGGAVRRARVQAELGRELSGVLHTLSDPRLQGVSVTRVELSDDLRVARVMVRITMGDDGVDRRHRATRALQGVAGRLRGRVGRTMGLRHAPELRFAYDEGLDAARRVDELLAEIAEESPESSR